MDGSAGSENDNLAVGYGALGGSISGGEFNVAIGNYALDANTSGDDNTGIGYNAMTALTTGSGNVSFGRASGTTITTGSNNTVIGKGADVSASGAENQVVIGQGATGHGDNIAVIGNGSATAIHPHDDNEVDLGSSSYEFKDLYIHGTANLDAVDIDGGAIDGAAIGSNSASTGAFSTISASGAVSLADGSAGSPTLTNTGDTNTGLYFSAADEVAVATGGADRMIIDSNSEISLSNNDSGNFNTLFGKSAGLSLDAGSNYNVFVGEGVSDATMDNARDNIGIGYQALSALTTGDYNTASGFQSLYANTTGSSNTASGWGSLYDKTTAN